MNEYPFQFAVLRYIHDPVTEEFLNVGIVLYSKEARLVRAMVTARYRRLSNTFVTINGEHYRRLVNFVESRLEHINDKFKQRVLFSDLPDTIELLLQEVLPVDDSSMAFSGIGAGLSSDLDESLVGLYERMVEKYIKKDELESRSNQEIWQVFSRLLDRHDVTSHLSPVTIEAPTYNYHFDHAWKNERWHPIEPVSLDLVYERSILEKANSWIGRARMLEGSDQIETLHLLVGAPSRPALRNAYENAATNIRENIQLDLELIEESDAAAFSESFAKLISSH